MARVWTEVKQRSKSSPLAAISSPASFASLAPRSVRSTSHQPVKRFSRFHADWPWRINTSLGMSAALRQLIDDRVERIEARAAEGAAAFGRPAMVRIGQVVIVLERHLQRHRRSEEHTSELQSLMRISYDVFCLKTNTHNDNTHITNKR